MLHPQYKTEYFEEEGWKKNCIDTARDHLTEQWETYYRDAETPEVVQEVTPEVVSLYHVLCCRMSCTNVNFRR